VLAISYVYIENIATFLNSAYPLTDRRSRVDLLSHVTTIQSRRLQFEGMFENNVGNVAKKRRKKAALGGMSLDPN
jgi:hypothetical protein